MTSNDDDIYTHIGNIGSLWGCQRRWLKPHEAVFSQEVQHPSVRQKAEPRLPNAAANAKALKIARLYSQKHRFNIGFREKPATFFAFERTFFRRISKKHPLVVSLISKLTTKKLRSLWKDFFRISDYNLSYDSVLNSSARWHRVASLRPSDYATNEYLYVCNRDAGNCHKLPRSMAARLTTGREENVILINRYGRRTRKMNRPRKYPWKSRSSVQRAEHRRNTCANEC